MRILVASANPVKIAAVKTAAAAMFPGTDITVDGQKTTLADLPDQPVGDAETRDCALRRAMALRAGGSRADYYIGLEGGITTMADAKGIERLYGFAWMVILNTHDAMGEGRTAMFMIPDRVRRLIATGLELGAANDQVFGESNSKQQGGATGLLTDNAVLRTDLYFQPLCFAFAAFTKAEIYA